MACKCIKCGGPGTCGEDYCYQCWIEESAKEKNRKEQEEAENAEGMAEYDRR